MVEKGENRIRKPLQEDMVPSKSDEIISSTFRRNMVGKEMYGCFTFRPRFLQVFNDIRWHVFWQCVFTFFEGFIVNGVINVIIPTLEKRYEMPSSRSAIIASSYDFGALIVLVFISYYGGQRNKPRLMAAGVFLMSVGSLIFSLPQFVGGKYQYIISGGINGSQNLCERQKDNYSSDCSVESNGNAAYNGYFAYFLIGQALLGIGAVPMFTVGLAYIDENCKPKLTSFYIGCTFCSAAVGVAVGYIVGGQTLSYFVDVDKLDPSTVSLTPADPQWVGAWWIGILLAFLGFLVIGIPILGYPKHLPGYDQLKTLRKSEVHNDGAEDITTRPDFGKSFKDFPRSLFLLIKNPAFLFLCLSATMEWLFIGGLATFGAKLFQEFYHLDLTNAGFIMGIITIPGSGGGMLLGGYLVKKFNMDFRGIVRYCAVSIFICALFAPSFLASCPSQPLAGITESYKNESYTQGLTADCNRDCQCSTAGFEPVCDSSKTVYFSPCHAGCTGMNVSGDVKEYVNCSCISDDISRQSDDVKYDAIGGLCMEKCVWFYVFCVLLFFIMLFTFSTMPPNTTGTFRCVPEKQRSLAMGLKLLVVRLLGSTPGPILLGSIIDSACSVWQETCGETGSCWVYHKSDLSIRLVVWCAVLKLMAMLFALMASKLYTPMPKDKTLTNFDKFNDVPSTGETRA